MEKFEISLQQAYRNAYKIQNIECVLEYFNVQQTENSPDCRRL